MSIKNEFAILKNNINVGKTSIATAITEKGIQTANNATLATMAANIKKIQQGGGSATEKSISELIMPKPRQIATIEGNPHYIKYYYNQQTNNEYFICPDGFMSSVNLFNTSFNKYGSIRKKNGGYDRLEQIEMVDYNINNSDYVSVFAIDSNYNLLAGYGYLNTIPSEQFYIGDSESANSGLLNLTNMKHIFGIDKIGMGFATDNNGKGYFVFPLGPYEYNSGYVYISVDQITGETVDFNNFNTAYDGIANNSDELQTDFKPVQYVHDDGYGDKVILVCDSTFYVFEYTCNNVYDLNNYNNVLSFASKINCNDNVHSFGIDFPYLYANSRYSNSYSVDLTNNYGSMQTISMYGRNLKYTKIDDKFYSVRKGYLYLLQNGDKVSYKSDQGLQVIRNSVTLSIGEGKNIWHFISAYEILISKYEVDSFKFYSFIDNSSSSFMFNNTATIDKDGNLFIINSGTLYKLEKDPKVTI